MRCPSVRFHFCQLLRHLTLRLFCAWALLGVVSEARAHRPNESSLQLRWEHGRLECQFVASLQIATAILADPDIPGIGSDNFPALRERLTTQIATAFAIEIAGRPVSPAEVFVALSPEGELSCAILFAPSPPAALNIRALFFERCPAGTFCWVRLWQDADRLSAQKLLTRSSPQASFPAPPADSPPPPAAAPAPSSPAAH